ncbi:hypothetical protein KCU93_g7882, partial [Aureobasidium melanogenum]
MQVLQKNFFVVVLLAALILSTHSVTAVPQQEILDMDTDTELDLTSKPTLARFAIEDLSPTEWQAEHERVRAELGDEAYLALRQSEVKEKMESIIKLIRAGKWQLPPLKGSQQPDRIGLANGREFRVGVAQGVPEDITEAMWGAFDSEDEIQEVPDEWLGYEVSREQLEEEERQNNEKLKQRAVDERRKILDGEGVLKAEV